MRAFRILPMKAKLFCLCLAIGCVLAGGAKASAAVLVHDHFDDGALSADWNVSQSGVSGWTYTESGTELEVTDISGVAVGTWGTVTLSQTFDSLSDFSASLNLSWGEGHPAADMKTLRLAVLDGGGNEVAWGQYYDGWQNTTGTKQASIVGTANNYGTSGELPSSGAEILTIDRVGSTIDVKWGGVTLVTSAAASTVPIESVEITFGRFNYNGWSTFGSEAVDLVHVEGTVIPEPSTLGLLLMGVLGVATAQRRKRR